MENNNKRALKKVIIYGLVLLIVFFIGVSIGSNGSEDYEATIAEMEQDLLNWKLLKTTDDELLNLCSDSLGYCSDGYSAISELNYYKLNAVNEKMIKLVPEVEKQAERRQELLEVLGY